MVGLDFGEGSLILLLWVSLAGARPLAYTEALRQALEANPEVQRAELAARSSQGGLLAARGFIDPTFEVGTAADRSLSKGFFQGFPFESRSRSSNSDLSLTGTTPTGTSYGVTGRLDRNFSNFVTNFGGIEQEQIQDTWSGNLNASLTQQLLKGVRMSYNLQNVTRSQIGLDQAALTLETTRQSVLEQTATAYWTWVYQDARAKIAEDGVSVAREALRVGELQLAAGQLAPVERTRLEAALVQAESGALEARNAADQARDALLLLLGDRPGQPLEPATPADDRLPVAVEASRAVEVALAQNLELAASRKALDLAESEEDWAQHGLLPSLSLTVSGGSASQVPDGSAGQAVGQIFSEPLPFLSVGGRFSMPLGNRAARGARDQAQLSASSRQVDLAEAERSVSSQVEQQVRALASAERRVALADANVRLAAETLAAEEALAAAGRAIQKDVLEARQALEDARVEAVKARTDWRLAEVTLRRLQGVLDVER